MLPPIVLELPSNSGHFFTNCTFEYYTHEAISYWPLWCNVKSCNDKSRCSALSTNDSFEAKKKRKKKNIMQHSDTTFGFGIICGSAGLPNETKQSLKRWAVTDVWSFPLKRKKKLSWKPNPVRCCFSRNIKQLGGTCQNLAIVLCLWTSSYSWIRINV